MSYKLAPESASYPRYTLKQELCPNQIDQIDIFRFVQNLTRLLQN